MGIRTFRECEEVKAIVSVGCCYNLLSEEGISANSQCGFPISNGGRAVGLSLGKSARDLACQVFVYLICFSFFVCLVKSHQNSRDISRFCAYLYETT